MNNNPTGKGGWKKGQSGNPKGRAKKGSTHTDQLKALLGMSVDELNKMVRRKGISAAQVSLIGLIKDSIKGGAPSHRIIFEYIDGRPTQRLEHGGVGGGPVEIIFPKEFDEEPSEKESG